MFALAPLLLAALRRAGRANGPADTTSLEPVVAEFVDRARSAVPEVSVNPGAFLTFVADRLPEDMSLPEALASLNAPDLFLAHACLAGDPRALAAFDALHMKRVPAYVARYLRAAEQVDELKQTLRVRLLLSGPRTGPQLAGYSGRGPLGGWLRVAAVRAAIDLLRQRSPELPDPAAAQGATAPVADAELAFLKARYAPAFQRAFEDALGALPARERTMLRLHVVDGMTLTAIARAFRVNPSTVHRAIARVRERVLEETLHALGDELGVGETQAESIVRLVQSRIDVDLRRCLETRE